MLNIIPIIIDVEASGFGRGSYPIEVGVVLGDGTTHCFLIKPHASWHHWDTDAEAVHGISRRILQTFGKPVRDVAQALNELLQHKTAYSDAWGHDRSWLAKLFDAAELPQRFHLESLRGLLGERQLPRWHPVKSEITDVLGRQRHRASTDALILQRTLRAVVEPD